MKVSRLSVLFFAYLFQFCTSQSDYKFIIFNDIKGELEDYNRGTETDKPVRCSAGSTCIGGFSKIVQQIDVFRNESDASETFVLTPGNLVGGESGWLSILGWKRYGGLLQKFYKPTAMTLGMNDFGAGLNRTLDYVDAASTPVVLSNVDCAAATTGTIEGDFCSHPLINNKDVHKLGSSIGLVGFVNPDVMKLSSPGGLRFKDVIPSLKQMISASTPKYSTYVAMGDGSLELAKQILAQIPQIKLVIYGRTFGNSKDMTGNFPEKSGAGYIATGGNYGSRVGKFLASTGGDGKFTVNAGSTLAFTNLTVVNTHLIDEFQKLEAEAKKDNATDPIASTHYKLVGGKECWRRECNLGNLVTDAMVHCVFNHASRSIPSRQPIFALWHSGALFQDSVEADSNITPLDIHKWLPYHNRVYLARIQGSRLLEVFQRSATGITADKNAAVKDWGQFLQVSNGMEVYYSTSGGNPRVSQIRLLHDDKTTPVMQPLNPNAAYYFVIPSFIMDGRNVYDFPKTYWELAEAIDYDDTCVENYVRAMKRVATGFEERIWIDSKLFEVCTDTVTGTSTAVTVIVTVVITLILVGVAYAAYFYVIPHLTGKRPDGFNNI